MLQGIIDCAFLEHGQWVLFDYKSDVIRDEKEFVEKYERQLQYYRQALEAITGIPVKETCLYALQNGKTYSL